MVLADGSFVTADEEQNSDLFWGVRGGGGNFGVVTSFTFRTHPVGTVTAGPIFWPVEDAPEVMRRFEDFITDAPEEINGFFAFLVVPPVPTVSGGAPHADRLRRRMVQPGRSSAH